MNSVLFEDICSLIISAKPNHPTRICVDGVTASGKTTFATNLAKNLSSKGFNAVHTSLDGFHNPREVRHAKGKQSPEGYYFDAYNYQKIIQDLLNPLGPNGDLKYRTKFFDLENNVENPDPWQSMQKDGYLIVDGSFSLRKELQPFWDFKIYLKVDMELAQIRAGDRDEKLFGSKSLAIETTKSRYHGAHKIHNELVVPWEVADVVVNNNDPTRPILEKSPV